MPRRTHWLSSFYRAGLHIYPRRFQNRFGPDLEADALQLLEERGPARASFQLVQDLLHSAPEIWAAERRLRARERALGPVRETFMTSLWFDIRHAVRALLKAPVFTAVTILTLALGIGANSATFSLVNAALLRPLEFKDPEQLMLVFEGIPQADLPKIPAAPADILDLQRYQRSFVGVTPYHSSSMELSTGSTPTRIEVTRAGAGLFSLLGVEPMIGRTFTALEDRPGHDVVVLSYSLWQRVFRGQPDILGRPLRLDRRPFTIVGIMPASFEFPRRGPLFNSTPADVWIPRAFSAEETSARGMYFNNSVLARLAPGVTLTQAQSEMKAMGRRIRENYPAELQSMQLDVTVEPLTDEISGQVRAPLLVLFGAVALVLMVACANVANLVLSRAAVRQRELGVRQALGARRLRLAQLLLSEALLLSAAGGVIGLGLAQGLLRAVPTTLAESLPGLQHASLDVRLVLFTTVTAVATALIFGLLPLFISDRDVAGRLHEGSGRTAGGGRAERVQRALVSATVSLAFVLLVGAGLLVRSFNALVATEPGFAPHRVLSLSLDLPREGYPTGQSVLTLARTAFERSQSVPGVQAATISTDLPLESNERRAVTPDTRVPIKGLPAVAVTWVYGDYFRTLGIPVRQGRPFTPTEDQTPRGVVILSESLAARCFPGEDPIGKRVKWGIAESHSPWMTVVGVVGDVKDGSLRDDPTIHVYVPFSLLPDELDRLPPNSSFGRSMRIGLQAKGDPAALVGSSRILVSALDRSLPVTRVATMQQQIDVSVAPNRFSTVVLTAFAAVALLLAAIGLYGVLAFAITQRTREIGVRMALGASRTSVLRLVVGQGMRLVVIGLVVGLASALALTRVMTSLLYRTQPYDVWTFVLTAAVLSAVAALACYLPARRAAAVEPMKALRTE